MFPSSPFLWNYGKLIEDRSFLTSMMRIRHRLATPTPYFQLFRLLLPIPKPKFEFFRLRLSSPTPVIWLVRIISTPIYDSDLGLRLRILLQNNYIKKIAFIYFRKKEEHEGDLSREERRLSFSNYPSLISITLPCIIYNE